MLLNGVWRAGRNRNSRDVNSGSSFVELVPEEKDYEEKSLTLKKVEARFEFDDFSFSIDGQVSNEKLRAIIELLSCSC